MQGRISYSLLVDSLASLREKILDKMSHQTIDYYEKKRVGEIMDRYGNGVSVISWWVNSLCDGALANMLQALFIIVVLFLKAFPIGILMALVMAFSLYDSYRKLIYARPFNRGWMTHIGKMSGLMSELFSNIATVRSFGGEAAIRKRYLENQAFWKDQREKVYRVNSAFDIRRNVVNALAIFGAICFVCWGTLHGRYNPGDILLVLLLTQSLTVTITPISSLINQAGEADASAERLQELINVESAVLDEPGAVDLQSIESVAFDNVSFAYPGKQGPALNDVSFSLTAGQTLALVDPSGSGKTTIIKLLLRFYDTTGGRILINGQDIRTFTKNSVRSLFGVVLQDVALFNDSIEENIAFARPDARSEDVRRAARGAYADVFIDKLPNKYETLVGERGIRLSGGEKQRIAIARALLKDPQMIILDEATSALDSESERFVQSGLRELMRGRTAVVIAHRLSTIANADIIVVLKDGRVIETGRHANLIHNADGLYAKLHALQNEAAVEQSGAPAA